MNTPLSVLLANACASVFLTGVIWYVQIAHYPLFPLADMARFGDYEARLIRRTGVITAPVMAVELATSIWLLCIDLPDTSMTLGWIGLVVTLSTWLVTGFIQLPLHLNLTRGFNEHLFRLVLDTNWLRVVLWSARTAIALGLLRQAL